MSSPTRRSCLARNQCIVCPDRADALDRVPYCLELAVPPCSAWGRWQLRRFAPFAAAEVARGVRQAGRSRDRLLDAVPRGAAERHRSPRSRARLGGGHLSVDERSQGAGDRAVWREIAAGWHVASDIHHRPERGVCAPSHGGSGIARCLIPFGPRVVVEAGPRTSLPSVHPTMHNGRCCDGKRQTSNSASESLTWRTTRSACCVSSFRSTTRTAGACERDAAGSILKSQSRCV